MSASNDERTSEPQASEQGLNRATLGRVYRGAPATVDVETIHAYARATSDDNPRYLDEREPVAPPMYAVRLTKDVLFQPLLDPAVRVDLLMLLHGEQEMRFHGLLRPGELVHPRSEIAEIIDKDSGQILNLRMICERAGEGAPVCEATTTLFIRKRKKKEAPHESKPVAKAAPAEAPAGDVRWTIEDRVQVAPDQSRRYAAASRDDNPIHLDEATASAAGLPGIILQGLCTMAFCQRAVVNQVAGGDPSRLLRLKVRFAKPVFMGDTITVQGRVEEEQPGAQVISFRAVNQRGQEVISSGLAEVARTTRG